MQVLWCEMVKIFCICPCGSKAEPDVRGGLQLVQRVARVYQHPFTTATVMLMTSALLTGESKYCIDSNWIQTRTVTMGENSPGKRYGHNPTARSSVFRPQTNSFTVLHRTTPSLLITSALIAHFILLCAARRCFGQHCHLIARKLLIQSTAGVYV